MIDYRTTLFEEVVSDVDVVFDTLAGEARDRLWQVLGEGGRMVTIRSGGEIGEKAADYQVDATHVLVRPDKAHLDAITALVAAGRLQPRPHIEEVFPLERAVDAHRQSETGHSRGKLVLRVR